MALESDRTCAGRIESAIRAWRLSTKLHAKDIAGAAGVASALVIALSAEGLDGAAISAVFEAGCAMHTGTCHEASGKQEGDASDSGRSSSNAGANAGQPAESQAAASQRASSEDDDTRAQARAAPPADPYDWSGLGRFTDRERDTLFMMFGSWEGLAAAVTEMYERLKDDASTARFFVGKPQDRLVKHMVTFLGSTLLGRFMYSAEDLRKQHYGAIRRQGLGPEHVDIMTAHLQAVLREMGIQEATIQSAVDVLKQQKVAFAPAQPRCSRSDGALPVIAAIDRCPVGEQWAGPLSSDPAVNPDAHPDVHPDVSLAAAALASAANAGGVGAAGGTAPVALRVSRCPFAAC